MALLTLREELVHDQSLVFAIHQEKRSGPDRSFFNQTFWLRDLKVLAPEGPIHNGEGLNPVEVLIGGHHRHMHLLVPRRAFNASLTACYQGI